MLRDLRSRRNSPTTARSATGQASSVAHLISLPRPNCSCSRFTVSGSPRMRRNAPSPSARSSSTLLQDLPFEKDGHGGGQGEDQQKNRQLLGNGVTGLGDADPHIDASDNQPERDVSDRRRERRAGIVGGEEPTQQQRGGQQ